MIISPIWISLERVCEILDKDAENAKLWCLENKIISITKKGEIIYDKRSIDTVLTKIAKKSK